jgi:hypothetical protein
MLHRLGVVRGSNRIRIPLCSLLEPSADEPEVGGEVRIRRDDVELLGDRALNYAEKLGVERELQDSAAPGFLRELGIENLIRPRPERTRGIDPTKHVGSTEPATVPKR